MSQVQEQRLVRSGRRSPRSDTFSLDLRQIRLTVHAARPSVRVRAADRQFYMERDADHVELQSAQESDEAFEQAMYRKSALLQQRCRAGG